MSRFIRKVKKALFKSNNLIRIEILFATFFCLFFAFCLEYFTNLTFSWFMVILTAVSFFLVFLLSFFLNTLSSYLRNISNVVYISGMALVIYICYLNHFNLQSVYLFIICYVIYSFSLARIKVFITNISIIHLILLIALGALNFETDTGIYFILVSVIIICLAGFSTTTAREFKRKKLKDREQLLSVIFNRSSEGLLLINKKNEKIIEANEKAFKLLNIQGQEQLKNSSLTNLEIRNVPIFKEIKLNERKIVELKNGYLLSLLIQEISNEKNKYWLAEFSEYKNRQELSMSFDLDNQRSINEESYQNLFNYSASLICIINKDNKVIDVNYSLANFLGYSKEEIIGKEFNQLDHKNYFKERKTINEKAWEGRKQLFEKDIVAKNGEIINIEVILQKGKYFGEDVLISNSRDISQRKMLEKIAEFNQHQYNLLFKESPISLVIYDLQGEIIEINNSFEKLFKYKRNEILGRNIEQISFNKSEKFDFDQREFLMEGNVPFVEIQRKLYSKNEEIIHALLKIIIQKDENNKPSKFLAQIVDVTEFVKADEKIKRSEKKYRDLIEKSIFGIFIYKNNRIVYANNQAIKLLEYKNINEIINVHRDEIILEKDREKLDTRAQQILSGNNVSLQEFQLISKTGKKVFVESIPSLIDFDGEACILSSFVDISDRKIAERAELKIRKAISEKDSLSVQLEQNRQIQRRLQNSQAYSEGIIESSLDMIFTTDIKGRITRLNSAAKKQFKFGEGDYYNETFDILFEDREKSNTILKELDKNNSFAGEINLKRKDGSVFPAFLSISYLYSTRGSFLGIMGVSRDISDIISKEQEIKDQASKLTSIIESSSHYFFSVNREYRFTSFNQLFLNDVKDKQNVNIKYMDEYFVLLKDKKDEKELSKFWKEKFDIAFQGGSTNFEIERITSSGIEFFREIFLNPIYNEDGTIEEVSGIGHDTTQKKLYEIELKKSLQEKEILLKEVHHRVKNNMQVISSILSLQSAYVTDKATLSVLKDSQNRIRSMASIHERLYRTTNFSDVKFSSYVKDLSESILSTYELSSISVELVFSLDEVFLTLDTAIPCGLIINELISNSLKYAFKDRKYGVINIALYKKNGWVEMIIADNGIGISKDVNLENSDTLGLQLVNTLVDQIEGEITLETNEGTAYYIKFNPNL